MSAEKVQRPIPYVNNARRSIVLATRLLCNTLFDKVCPQSEVHRLAEGVCRFLSACAIIEATKSQEDAMRRWRALLIAAAVFSLAALACGSEGGGSYSFSTKRQATGDAGHIEITGDASGNVTSEVEIDEDWDEESVALDVTLEVQTGSCQVEFLDDFGSVVFSVAARPGQPGSGSGTVTTNEEGEINYQVTTESAEGIKITIDYELR